MSVDDALLQRSRLRKHPAMLVRQERPLNLGIPVERVRQSFITAQTHFFVRNHGTVPHVNPYDYRLSVTGLVRSPLQLSLSEIQAKFPVSTVLAVLQCAGHRREELAALHPIPGEIAWGVEAIGNALWRGVSLREILLAAGVEQEAQYVAFTGLDEIQKGEERFGFGGSIPMEKALCEEVLLAYEMNGEPLPPLHGYPLRVIVPGYIGARSVKWLANIHVQEQPSTNYFQLKAYRFFPPETREKDADWEQAPMLGDLPLHSVICHPTEGNVLMAGTHTITGYAITGVGHHVERVELSLDGGTTWIEASTQPGIQPWTWRFWRATLDLQPGQYQIIVRAWDSAGRTQPENLAQVWNWKGYLNAAWHRINVSVQEESI